MKRDGLIFDVVPVLNWKYHLKVLYRTDSNLNYQAVVNGSS